MHSKCGWNCGYVLDDKKFINYLDFSLLNLSKYFHLDYILFAAVNIYVYICSIYGFVNLGIRLFIFKVICINKVVRCEEEKY